MNEPDKTTLAGNSVESPQPPDVFPITIPRGQMATERRFIPNVPVINHLGQKFDFYNDLVKDRIVLIHLMSIHHDSKYPVARNLIQLQRRLGDRLGKSIFIHSITTQPQFDTLAKLRIFARRHRARNGWQFLTGSRLSIDAIRNCLFVQGAREINADRPRLLDSVEHGQQDCSLGLMRYGNDALGLWGSVPGKADPKMIVERLSWLSPKPKPEDGRIVRRGPFPNQQYVTGVMSSHD